MAKRILILSSSPRKGGNSDTLCDEFLRGAKEAGNDVEKIFLRDKKINYCTGCSTCSLHHKPCTQKDSAAEIVAQMKTLIDRCCGPYTEMNDKEFYFIVTAAEDDKEKMMRTVDTFQGFLDCLENPTIKGVVFGLGVWHVGEIKGNPAMQEAYETGKRV